MNIQLVWRSASPQRTVRECPDVHQTACRQPLPPKVQWPSSSGNLQSQSSWSWRSKPIHGWPHTVIECCRLWFGHKAPRQSTMILLQPLTRGPESVTLGVPESSQQMADIICCSRCVCSLSHNTNRTMLSSKLRLAQTHLDNSDATWVTGEMMTC